MSKAWLLLADGHTLPVDGLRKMEPEFDLIGALADGRSAVEAV